MIMVMEKAFGIRSNYSESYSWLLLFSDGNRIDVGIETVNALEKGKNRNKLYLPLIDKIGCLPELPPPTDEGFSVSTGKLNKYFKKLSSGNNLSKIFKKPIQTENMIIFGAQSGLQLSYFMILG